jgi:hypothetical protein
VVLVMAVLELQTLQLQDPEVLELPTPEVGVVGVETHKPVALVATEVQA